MMLSKTTYLFSKRVSTASYKSFSSGGPKKPAGGANDKPNSSASSNNANSQSQGDKKNASQGSQSNANSKESGFGSLFKAAFGGNQNATAQPSAASSTQNAAKNASTHNASTQTSSTAKNASTQTASHSAKPSSASQSTQHTNTNISTATGNPQSVQPTRAKTSAVQNEEAVGDITTPGYERARTELQFDNVGVRYAYLLWGMYKSANQLDQLDTDLAQFVDAVESSEGLRKVFEENELLTESNRSDALEEFFEETDKPIVSEKMVAFLRTVAEMRRLRDLSPIFQSLDQVRQRLERNVHTAHVASAKKLTDAEKDQIRKTVQETFKPDGEVEIVEELKPSLGGGYEIFYDGLFHLDNTQQSLVTELNDDIDNQIANFMGKGAAPSGH